MLIELAEKNVGKLDEAFGETGLVVALDSLLESAKYLAEHDKKASEEDELVFASAEKGVQYLTDLLGKQVIVANDDDEDEDDDEEEEEEEEEAELEREEGTCPSCGGSGEGAQEGTKCRVCGGSGDSSKPWGSAKKRREREGSMLRFTSATEGIQHLAELTGQRIVVTDEKNKEL